MALSMETGMRDGRDTGTNIVHFLEFYSSKCFFFSIIRKYMISLLPHEMKSLNKTFTLVSAGFETCQNRQRRLLFEEKNGHVTVT